MEQKSLREIAFVVRGSGAATGAYELAAGLGLAQATLAAMSVVIVPPERLHETRSFLIGRVLGTIFGMTVTIRVSKITSHAAASIAVQLVVAVAICALVAREFPNFRVAMWTWPIVLLAAQAATPTISVVTSRAAE